MILNITLWPLINGGLEQTGVEVGVGTILKINKRGGLSFRKIIFE